MTIFTLLTIPAIVVIMVTGVFGLADVRPIGQMFSRGGSKFDYILGLTFFSTTVGVTGHFFNILEGEHRVYFWECVLSWGIAGTFLMIGHYAPWRKWIRRDDR